MSSFLSIGKLSKTFAHRGTTQKVLDEITLNVQQGEFLAIIGPSGCGKTTLLECIAGLIDPDHGEIRLNERDICNTTGHAAYMTQSDVLLPWRMVLENVSIPLEIQGVERSQALQKAHVLIEEFGLHEFSQHFPWQISGGMQQRVVLARTYLTGKGLLLLDEPFSKLDAITRRQMHEWFLHIWERERKTVVFVTHDIDEAVTLADRVIVLSRRPARIIQDTRIPIERPRTAEVLLSPAFNECKREVMKNLMNGE